MGRSSSNNALADKEAEATRLLLLLLLRSVRPGKCVPNLAIGRSAVREKTRQVRESSGETTNINNIIAFLSPSPPPPTCAVSAVSLAGGSSISQMYSLCTLYAGMCIVVVLYQTLLKHYYTPLCVALLAIFATSDPLRGRLFALSLSLKEVQPATRRAHTQRVVHTHEVSISERDLLRMTDRFVVSGGGELRML